MIQYNTIQKRSTTIIMADIKEFTEEEKRELIEKDNRLAYDATKIKIGDITILLGMHNLTNIERKMLMIQRWRAIYDMIYNSGQDDILFVLSQLELKIFHAMLLYNAYTNNTKDAKDAKAEYDVLYKTATDALHKLDCTMSVEFSQ